MFVFFCFLLFSGSEVNIFIYMSKEGYGKVQDSAKM